MKQGVVYTGIPSAEELANCPGVPSRERMEQGKVAVIECVQEIPCNPCEASCRFGAIHVGAAITSLPVLKEDACTGCGQCVAQCPGLAIFMVDMTYSDTQATVDFPYEYLPLPQKGERVQAVDRGGQVVCEAEVAAVRQAKSYVGTRVVSLIVPKEHAGQVRSMKRLPKIQEGALSMDDKLIICRCQEVTRAEVIRAIEEGATTIDGVKKRTRAGMGLCQGKTCERLVAGIIAQQTGQRMEDILPATYRAPVRPVPLDAFLGGDEE